MKSLGQEAIERIVIERIAIERLGDLRREAGFVKREAYEIRFTRYASRNTLHEVRFTRYEDKND